MSAIGMLADGQLALSSSALSPLLVLSSDAYPKLISYGPNELSKWRTERVI